ncbi:Cytochrome P450 94B3 [Nymphaea thermarum]|nr:Cytochrome P450 94B3 [Nymphaea thermarum]
MLVVGIILLVLLLLGSALLGAKTCGYKPPSLPILGCLISFSKNRQRLLQWYTELLSQSPTGTILVDRVGSNLLIITVNPANVEHILKTRFYNYPKGRPFTDILKDLLGRGIFNVDGELWRRQRRALSHVFTTRSLRDLVLRTVEVEAHQRLLPLLQSANMNGLTIDLQDVLSRFTFDTVCKVSFDMDPLCLHSTMPVSRLVHAFDIATQISAKRATEPLPLIWKAKRAMNMGSERRLREAIDAVHESITEMIQRKRNSGGDDLLSRILTLSDKDEEFARDMVISFLLAVRDTVSAALTWFFWLLCDHPDVQEKVVEEIRSRHEVLDFKGLQELKFLKACLCESMRLYPPVPWDSKHAKNDDVLPDGTLVPKGSRVTYFPYGMGRMENLWGKDCLEFRPERWMSSETTNIGDDFVSVYKFPVFQAGPRQCLGKEMALMEMKYIAAFILSRFELRPVNDQKPQFVPFLTARMEGGFHVLVGKRIS